MKPWLLLIIIALSFCMQNCAPDDISPSETDCIDGDCTPADYETDGDIEEEQAESEQDREDENPPDLCAGVVCQPPGVCEKESVCNPINGECETVFNDAGDSCDDENACNGIDTCDGAGNCIAGQPVLCNENETCKEPEGFCDCPKPFMWRGDKCVPMNCALDADCDDGLVCNGAESCGVDSLCAPGSAIECDSTRQCAEPQGECLCRDEYYQSESECVLKPPCPTPQGIAMSPIHKRAQIQFTAPQDYILQISIGENTTDTWIIADSYQFDQIGSIKLLARTQSDNCFGGHNFSFRYSVMESYPPSAGVDGSTAVHMSSEAFKAWASGYLEPVEYGDEVDDTWRTPDKALGAATGSTTDIVSLGRGGSITLTFNSPIKNGPDYDFAIFENSFNDQFLELAYVEVSSDGENFLRFDSAYLGTEEIGAFAYHDTSLIGGLAGKYRVAYGTPFDLAELTNTNAVLEGDVDLNDIRYVRIIDIVGDGSALDSFGNIIYDPYPTVGSAGFDLEAVGVINN